MNLKDAQPETVQRKVGGVILQVEGISLALTGPLQLLLVNLGVKAFILEPPTGNTPIEEIDRRSGWLDTVMASFTDAGWPLYIVTFGANNRFDRESP